MNHSLRVAIVGVGRMGSKHARVLANIDNIRLTAIADSDKHQTIDISQRYDVTVYSNPLVMLDKEKLDAISICTPTSSHFSLVMEAAQRGIHILVEKPLALSTEQGAKMVETAKKAGIVLMVGHIARFNPTMIALRNLILDGKLGRIFQLESRRTSSYPKHVSDIGVALDLAVHDLDIMRYITNSEVERIYAEMDRHIHSMFEDQLIGLLRFTNGIIGKVAVNWLTPIKLRELVIIGEHGTLVINNFTKDLVFYNATLSKALNGNEPPNNTNGEFAKYYTKQNQDCLQAELESFVSTIQNGTQPPVSGHDGLVALALAEALIKSGKEQRIIKVNNANEF